MLKIKHLNTFLYSVSFYSVLCSRKRTTYFFYFASVQTYLQRLNHDSTSCTFLYKLWATQMPLAATTGARNLHICTPRVNLIGQQVLKPAPCFCMIIENTLYDAVPMIRSSRKDLIKQGIHLPF